MHFVILLKRKLLLSIFCSFCPKPLLIATLLLAASASVWAAPQELDWTVLEKQFCELPMEARRLTGPLFWLHGDESQERLEMTLEKVAESGNGCFTAESRPHNDWLGPGWYRDLAICLKKAKELNLKMWIFDERWWPSQMVGGKVPLEYGSKTLVAKALDVVGPKTVSIPDCSSRYFIGAAAGRNTGSGVDGASLIDLSPHIKNGTLNWQAPGGQWKVMTFHWTFTGPKGMQKKWIAVDGAGPDCVDWFLKTVYQPHYDHFKDDFGKTIPGFFYDEPETLGDWGSDLMTLLAERKVDWKKAFVAWKFKLAGEEHIAARYQYADAFAEAWGRTMYGGMSRWCREHNVISMGHFMEHGTCLFNRRLCAGNLFQLQKYSDMGGIDLVCRQFYPGQRKVGQWQMARLGSSISHVYGKTDDIAMCEIFGAYGQDVTYPQMKWLTDQMQVRGVNYMVPHSFNPHAPYDRDCPPYFYNGGYEPRYPLHRVYCDYTSRLSLLLSGGRHVAPVAFLFLGQSYHAGMKIRPDEMSDALDDALFDCDWMPYDAFNESRINGGTIALHKERYQVLVVPAAEVIPYATLAKAKAFYDAGGIVVGYGFLPSKSATLQKTSADIAALTEAVWGRAPQPGTRACRTNRKGGRSYFLPAKPSPMEIQQALTVDAGLHPDLEVIDGETDRWLHVLHRVKSGRDVFLICNQDHKRPAKTFRFRIRADGYPECWDAMRNELTSVPYRRVAGAAEVDLTLEPMESVLLVFQKNPRALPSRIDVNVKPIREPISIIRDMTQKVEVPMIPVADDEKDFALKNCSWIWSPEGSPAQSAPPGTRWFRKTFTLPADRPIQKAKVVISADNEFVLHVNGRQVGRGANWQTPLTFDIKKHLKADANILAVAAVNAGDQPNPAGLIGTVIVTFELGETLTIRSDASWKVTNQKEQGWEKSRHADNFWKQAKIAARFGQGPWASLSSSGRITVSPMADPDPFYGRCSVPEDIDLSKYRVCLEMDGVPEPELAAAVHVNGKYAGGAIGKPLRLNVTQLLKTGVNTIEIKPAAPREARLILFPFHTNNP